MLSLRGSAKNEELRQELTRSLSSLAPSQGTYSITLIPQYVLDYWYTLEVYISL